MSVFGRRFPCAKLGFVQIYTKDVYKRQIIGLAAGNIRGLAGIPSNTGKDGPYISGKLRYGRIFIKRKM